MGVCDTNRKVTKVLTIVGAWLILSPSGVHWFWGNLSTYVLSYIFEHSPPVSGSEATWVSSLYLMVQAITLMGADYLMRYLGHRLTAVLGIIVFNAGIFICYFVINHSILLINISLGAISGLGGGFLLGTGLKYGIQWSSEKDIGLITALLQSSYTVFAIGVNQFITFHINPTNEAPDLSHEHYLFFSQTDVLARTPSVFLYLGVIFTAVQIVGLALVRDNPLFAPITAEKEKGEEDQDVIEASEARKGVLYTVTMDTSQSIIEPKEIRPIEAPGSISEQDGVSVTETLGSDYKANSSRLVGSTGPSCGSKCNATTEHSASTCETVYGSTSSDTMEYSESQYYRQDDTMPKPSASPCAADGTVSSPVSQDENISPRQVIRTVAFHVIWIAFFMNEYSFVMVTVYYKAFGQLWINDDFFFTILGTALVITISIVKVMSGVVVDKLGIKNVLMSYHSVVAISGAFFYIAPQLDMVFYFVLSMVLTSLSGTVFFVYTVGTITLFGRRHAIVNISLVTMATILMTLVAPPLMKFLLDVGGWAGLFFSGAVFSVVSLFLVIFGLPLV